MAGLLYAAPTIGIEGARHRDDRDERGAGKGTQGDLQRDRG